MNNEEKILSILEKHSEMFEQLNSRMESLESGQAALEGRIERVNGDLKTNNLLIRNLESKQAAFEGRMGRLEDDLTSVKLRLELDIEKRFDAVNEGIDAILAQLTPKRKMEEMDADIVVLKAAVKMLTQEVAELKKAQ